MLISHARHAVSCRHAGGRTGSSLPAVSQSLRVVMLKYIDAHGRGEISGMTCADLADQVGQRHCALTGNLLYPIPKFIFQADAGLLTRDNDRALGAAQLHWLHALHAERCDRTVRINENDFGCQLDRRVRNLRGFGEAWPHDARPYQIPQGWIW